MYEVNDSLVAWIQYKVNRLELSTMTMLLILWVRSHKVMGNASSQRVKDVSCQPDATVVFAVDLKESQVQKNIRKAYNPSPFQTSTLFSQCSFGFNSCREELHTLHYSPHFRSQDYFTASSGKLGMWQMYMYYHKQTSHTCISKLNTHTYTSTPKTPSFVAFHGNSLASPKLPYNY